MDKSYVGMGYHICPICGKKQECVLLDQRLRSQFENGKDYYLGFDICSDCEGNINKGYVALVGVCNHGIGTHLKQEEANRTGDLLFLKEEVFNQMFNVEVPKSKMVFVDIEVIRLLKSKVSAEEVEN